ncbi:hypothetical protein [Nocardia beijingensis]|uniref:hypothetical protein n=1 Tax=Nocardia beijingensis TaxID=95162 RepID=UPI00083141EE|nr:hypothetical protein [Nocardia beijingensis]
MEVWVPVFGAAVTAFGAVLIALYTQRQTRRDVRTMIKSDLEALKLLKDLNPGGPEVTTLQGHIEWRIKELAAHERSARRNWPQVFAGLLVWAVAFGIAIPAFNYGSWWRWLLVPAALLFIFGCGGLPALRKTVRET